MSYKDSVKQQRQFSEKREKKNKKKTYYGDGSYTEADFQNYLNNHKPQNAYSTFVKENNNRKIKSEALEKYKEKNKVETLEKKNKFGVAEPYQEIKKPVISITQEELNKKFGGQTLGKTSDGYTPLSLEEIKKTVDFNKDVEKSKLKSEQRIENTREFASKHPILGTGIATISDIASSLGTIQAGADTLTGKKTNPYYGAFAFNDYAEGARQGVKEGTKIPDDVVDLGISILSSGTRAMAGGPVGMALAGTSATSSAFRDAKERGASDLKAKGYGLVQGLIEAGTEKFSIEGLNAFKNEPVKSMKIFFKNLGKQMITEGSEETASEVLGNISDSLIMKEASNYNLYKNYLLAQGYSEEEAERGTFKEMAKNIGKAAIGGAISGGVLGGSLMGANTLLNSIDGKNSKIAEDTTYREFADSVDVNPQNYVNQNGVENTEALEKAEKLKSIAEELAIKEENGEKINNLEKAELEYATNDLLYTASQSEEDYYKNLASDNADNEITTDNEIAENRVGEPIQDIDSKVNAEALQDTHTISNTNDLELSENIAPINEEPMLINEGFEPMVEMETLESEPITLESLAREVVPTNSEAPSAPIRTPYSNLRMPYATNIRETVDTLGSSMPKGATDIMVSMYDGNVDMGLYMQAFKRAYNAGKNNVTLSVTNNGTLFGVLSDEQMKAAYKAGAQDRNIAIEKAKSIKTTPKLNKRGGLNKISENATEEQKKLADKVGKRTGLIINISEEVDQAEYDPNNKTITISPYSKNFNQSLTHELTHYLQDSAPTAYRKFKETVVSALMEAKDYDYDQAYALYEKAYEEVDVRDVDLVTDEMVADATGLFFNDAEFINNIVKDNRSIAAKIRDFFADVIEAIERMISKENIRDVAYALAENKAKYRMAYNLWNDALVEASNNEVIEDTAEDIRYQLDIDNTTLDTEALVNANKELQETEKYLTQQLASKNNHMPNRQDINKIAKSLVERIDSWKSQREVADKLYTFYNYIHNNDYLDGSEVSAIAKDIAGDLLAYSKNDFDSIQADMFNDLKSYLQKTDIKMPSKEFDSEFASKGGLNEFRKKYFGILKLNKEKGSPVDVAYTELSECFPDMFPNDIINPADQLIQIGETIDMLRPVAKFNEELDEITFDEASYLLGQEIIDAYFDVRYTPGKDTKLDKRSTALREYKRKLKTEYTEEIARLKKETKTLNKELSKQQRENEKTKDYYWNRVDKMEQKQDALKAKHKLEKQAIANLNKQRIQKIRDNNKSAQYKATIKKDLKEISNMLLKPTDKKHVPEVLRAPLADFLTSVQFMGSKTRSDGTESNTWREWQKLQDAYEAISKSGGIINENGMQYYLDIDDDIVGKMKELKKDVENMGDIKEFTSYQYENLKEIVKAIKKTITDANKLLANNRYKDIETIGKATIEELSKLDNKVESGISVLRKADVLINNSMLDSYTRFNTFGDSASTLYDELREGFNQKIRYTHEAQVYFENLMEKHGITQKTLREWSGNDAKLIKIKLSTGNTIEMKPSQVMSLYELVKRGQAKKHIFGGGIVVGETKVKTKHGTKVIKSTEPIKVSERDVLKIIDSLTEEQKQFADGIAKFFKEYTTKWGNKTSLELYGYEKFKADNYFPIKVSETFVNSKEGDLPKYSDVLRNLGMTKNTVPNASNPLVLEDIFDVYTKQVDRMGSYGSFVVPLSDLQKWLNYKDADFNNSIKNSLMAKFGKEAIDYILDLSRDINGVKSNNTMDNPTDLMKMFKSSAVGLNLKVAVQQPTAYFRALDAIDAKYLMKAVAEKADSDLWDRMKKYSPIAQWKDWGYFETNVGKSMKHIVLGTDSKYEKLRENQMYLAGKADELTWKRLWIAAELEIKDTTNLEVGSEEFYKAVGKRFDEIIDQTQVIDSVLHRSNIMKRSDMYTKMATAFMAEPIKSFNMLFRATNELIRAKTPEAKAKAKAKIVRASISFATAQTANSIISAIFRAMRDDDKEKELDEKLAKYFGEEMIDNFNPLKMMVYIKDVISVIEGFTVKRNDVAGYEELVKLLKDMASDIEKISNGEELSETPYGIMRKYLSPISSFTGIGIDNLERDVRALINTAFGLTGADDMLYKTEKLEKNIKSEANLSNYMNMAFNAYMEGNDELGDKIINDLVNAGIPQEKIDTRYKSLLKKEKYQGVKGNAKMQFYTEINKAGEDGNITDREVREIALDMMKNGVSESEAYELYRSRKKEDKKLDEWMKLGNEFDDFLESKNYIEDIKEKYKGTDNKEARQENVVDYIDSLNLNEESQKLLWEIAGYKVSENSYYKYF